MEDFINTSGGQDIDKCLFKLVPMNGSLGMRLHAIYDKNRVSNKLIDMYTFYQFRDMNFCEFISVSIDGIRTDYTNGREFMAAMRSIQQKFKNQIIFGLA